MFEFVKDRVDMFTLRVHIPVLLALAISPTVSHGQGTPVAPPTTLWRFMGVPQGFQKVRDVVTNRRGNRPGLERRDPIKRIADPANLESDNPAIKAAAEIKKAEDMKAQKIKAIKYLASIGCGCYDQDGKITEALLAATDDCTPDVREAAIEAIEDAAGNQCCKKCGSTSCCSEEIAKRLSAMAYERGDDGCPIEANAEIREAAARALKKCCPGGPPTGPILEEAPEPDPGPEPIPPPELPEPIPGEGFGDETGIPGESGGDADTDDAAEEGSLDLSSHGVPGIQFEVPEFRFHAVKKGPAGPNAGKGVQVRIATATSEPIHGAQTDSRVLPGPVRFRSEAPARILQVKESGTTTQSNFIDNAPQTVHAIPLPRVSQSQAAPVQRSGLLESETQGSDNAPTPVRRIPLPVR